MSQSRRCVSCHFALALLLLGGCASGWAFDPDLEEGVHDGVRVEWWYHWGFLVDEDGGEWACYSSFFRFRQDRLPLMRYLLHDLTDLRTGVRSMRSAAGREVVLLGAMMSGMRELPEPHAIFPGGPPEPAGAPLDLAYGPDRLERTGRRTYRLRAGDVDVELRAVSEPMAVEGTGLTGSDRPEDMHYYTIPRLEAAGTVRGRKARGLFWYDHQWGSSWVSPDLGWSWWGLQLDDGTDVNAYALRELATGRVVRSVCTTDAGVFPLEAEAKKFWTSEAGVRYPVRWRLRAGPLDLEVVPLFEARETPVLGDQKSIWEGPVRVTGTSTGKGFQELVGYEKEQSRNQESRIKNHASGEPR